MKNVVGIFDLDNTTGSHLTRAFLKNAEKAGQIVNISDDLPKSFIICTESGRTSSENAQTKIYLSQLASSTLYRRSASVRFD